MQTPSTTLGTVSNIGDAKRERRWLTLARFRRHHLAVAGLMVMVLLVVAALCAPLLAPYDPDLADLRAVRQAPTPVHPLGTDLTGRDMLSRLIYGGRISLTVGVLAVAIYVTIGTVLGALAGYFGGIVDLTIMRLTDTIMALPTLLIIIVFISVTGPSLTSVIAVIGLLGWPGTCRLVRGQFLSLRESEFITAARVVGAGSSRIIVMHLIPNMVSVLVVVSTFGMATAILLESSLSFLGLGVRPPTASWGGMLQDAQSPVVLSDLPWLWLSPGVMIAITVLTINFVGDGLRDAFDPRARP